MNNVIYINNKAAEHARVSAYHDKITRMPKQELLDEMVLFQEEWNAEHSPSSALIAQGCLLFKTIEEIVATSEFKLVARSWLGYLELRMKDFK